MHAMASQGELLCSQGLAYLANHPAANDAFTRLLERAGGADLPRDLVWRAEERQGDKGRPDLEAISGQTKWIKIEAKLGAGISYGQIASFAGDLPDAEGKLVVLLVPSKRRTEVAGLVAQWEAEVLAPCRWRLMAEDRPLVLLTWEEVFEHLREAGCWPAGGDLDQLVGLYQSLNNLYVAPFAPEDDADAARDSDRIRIIDKVTRKLAQDEGQAVMPLASEALADSAGGEVERNFVRRYAVKTHSGRKVSLAIGVRTPFEGYPTRVWARFRYDEPHFQEIWAKLTGPGGPFEDENRHRMSERHLWLPLDLPHHLAAEDVQLGLAKQIEEIWRVALG
ncbi:MAG: hypothetical protein FJ100_19495 [Deltaproteobacteria bacterium]|nr:hypothetical protein [Deltaproteobacteria bacterium]